jgi:hypothetical protein
VGWGEHGQMYANEGLPVVFFTCKQDAGSGAPELDGYQDGSPWYDSRLMKCAQAIFPAGLSPGSIVRELH